MMNERQENKWSQIENERLCSALPFISGNEMYLYFRKTIRTLIYANTYNKRVFLASHYFAG